MRSLRALGLCVASRAHRREAKSAFIGITIFCLGCALACGPRAACPPPAAGETGSAVCAAPCPAWSAKKGGSCVCSSDGTPWLGACVAASLASRACGTAETLVDGVCTAKTCGDDQVFDDSIGGCVAWSTVRAGDTNGGLPPAPDERVRCPTDSALLVSRSRARCLPRYACARGLFSIESMIGRLDAGVTDEAPRLGEGRAFTIPNDGGPPDLCKREPSCPPGALPEGHAGSADGGHTCTSFMTSNGFVDPARWLRLTAGGDGGAGSRWVCEPLDVLGVKIFEPRGAAHRISLQLDIPSNDVSQASLTARSDDAAEGTQRLEKGLEPYAEAFRSLGGTATTTQAAVHVICRVPASPRPVKLHVDGPAPPIAGSPAD